MREVTGDEHVAGFADEAIAYPLGRIVGLQIARRRQFRERVARAPERFGRLLRAQLAAVPDDRRPRTSLRRKVCEPVRVCPPDVGERTPGIDVRADGVAVVDEE